MIHRLPPDGSTVVDPRATAVLTLLTVMCLALADAGVAQAQTLTFDEVLARAREQAGHVSAARLPLNDADVRRSLAARRVTSPPSIEAIAGGDTGTPKGGSDVANGLGGASRRVGAEVTMTQMFDVGARRTARIAGAEASVARDRARAGDVTRLWVRDAALLFVRAQHVRAREQLLLAAERTAEAFLAAAERRYAVGDVAVLDVNVARAALAQARANRRAEMAERLDVLGQLRIRLGLPGDAPLIVDGRLEDLFSAPLDTTGLIGQTTVVAQQPAAFVSDALLDRHPALADLRGEVAEADAALAAARALAAPEVGVVGKYVRDQGTNTWLGGVALNLPMAARGREQQAIAAARVARARDALDLERRALAQEMRTAIDVHRVRVEAVRLLERDALPGLDENDALARRSYEAGELSLTDSLAVRQQALETRLSHLERVLDAATSGVQVRATAGVLR